MFSMSCVEIHVCHAWWCNKFWVCARASRSGSGAESESWLKIIIINLKSSHSNTRNIFTAESENEAYHIQFNAFFAQFSNVFVRLLCSAVNVALVVHLIHVPFRISTFHCSFSLACHDTVRVCTRRARSLLIHEYLSTTKTNLFITPTAKLWLHLDGERAWVRRSPGSPRQFRPRTSATAMIIFFINNMSNWLSLTLMWIFPEREEYLFSTKVSIL